MNYDIDDFMLTVHQNDLVALVFWVLNDPDDSNALFFQNRKELVHVIENIDTVYYVNNLAVDGVTIPESIIISRDSYPNEYYTFNKEKFKNRALACLLGK